MVDSKKIGKFIAMQRKQLSMTQGNLADKLNITNKAVSKWETGEGYPDISVLPALAEIFEVSVDEILKGEKDSAETNVNDRYRIKQNTEQANYILGKSIRHFANNYLLSISIMCIGIIVSSLGFKLYNGQYTSLVYSLMISLSSMIIGIMFYNNTYRGFASDIEKYNSMVKDKKLDIYKITHIRHIIFYAVYLVQSVILIFIIPSFPFRNIGYYYAYKKLYGYDPNHGRYWIDNDFCNIMIIAAYLILLCIGVVIIIRKNNKWKIQRHQHN